VIRRHASSYLYGAAWSPRITNAHNDIAAARIGFGPTEKVPVNL
jgi:hypothetical protein